MNQIAWLEADLFQKKVEVKTFIHLHIKVLLLAQVSFYDLTPYLNGISMSWLCGALQSVESAEHPKAQWLRKKEEKLA